MPVLRYFLYVGTLLLALLYGWSEYLQPAGTKAQAVLPPSNNMALVFRPTPAPPIADPEPLPSAEASVPRIVNEKEAAKVAPAKPKKRKAQVARRRVAPERSFAYVPTRQYFFGWR
jgi:hypothetical protein